MIRKLKMSHMFYVLGGLYFVFAVSFAYLHVREPYLTSPAQEHLLAEVKGLASKTVKYIVIEPFDLSPKNFKTIITNPI